MKTKFSLFIFFIFIISSFLSQEINLDIVKKQLQRSTLDSQKVRLLNILTENEPDNDIWPVYNDTMISVCLRNLVKSSPEKTNSYFKYYLGCGYNNKGVLVVGTNLFEGIKYFELSLENLSNTNDNELLLSILSNMGESYKKAGIYLKASEVYNKVLEKSLKADYKPGIVSAYNFLGGLAYHLQEYDRSKQYYFNSIKICKANNIEEDLGLSYSDLALVYNNLMEFDSSLFYFKLSLKLKLHKPVSAARTLVNIAIIYIQKNEFENAKQYLDEALVIVKQTNDSEINAYVKQAYARMYLKQKLYSQARQFAEASWQISSKSEDLSLKVGNTNVLWQIYEADGDGMKALQTYKLYRVLQDSSNNILLRNASTEIDIKHQYEKKGIIDSLKRNDEIKLSNYKLQEHQNQKYILFVVIGIITALGLVILRRFKISVHQNKVIEKQKNEVDNKSKIIEEKQKEILDSIHYANRIQKALLANKTSMNAEFNESFIFFKPKDIVSGDFYWTTTFKNKFYLAVCDSTGHGVPGAFMCLLNIGFLSEAIKEKGITRPNEIFNYARKRLIESIGFDGQQDGFDGILLCLDKVDMSTTYAAANNSPVLIRNGILNELPYDRMPVGKGESDSSFTNYTVDTSEETVLYLYTDGYADQFGGPKGKKFKYRELNKLLLSHNNKPMIFQEENIGKVFDEWRGKLEQVDDVCVIGIRIKESG